MSAPKCSFEASENCPINPAAMVNPVTVIDLPVVASEAVDIADRPPLKTGVKAMPLIQSVR